MSLSLLGGFALEADGRPLPLPVNAQRLLAYLGLAGRPGRGAVAGALWPEATDRHAMGSLRSAVWRVQRQDADILVRGDGGLSLDPQLHIDVHDLVDVAHGILTGRSDAIHPDGGAWPPAVLWRRELLPGWYEEWVLVERERLSQLRLHALERLALLLAERQLYGAALDAALACVRIEPLRESAHRTVIRIHMEEGNHREATRHFSHVCRLLDTELGLGPSPELARLGRRLNGYSLSYRHR